MALNGRFSDSLLAYLGWPEADHLRLVPAAAASITRLAAAFEAAFSKPLYISDAYRTFAVQVSLKATKGKFAATPGTSNHGLGIAIDAASRVNVDGSEEHRWFEANAPLFGWVNPAWAVDNNPANGQHEPWHWEFKGVPTKVPASPAPLTPLPLSEEDDMLIVFAGSAGTYLLSGGCLLGLDADDATELAAQGVKSVSITRDRYLEWVAKNASGVLIRDDNGSVAVSIGGAGFVPVSDPTSYDRLRGAGLPVVAVDTATWGRLAS